MQPKKWCHSLNIFLCPFFFNSIVVTGSNSNNNNSNNKNNQEAIGASDIAILPIWKHYNATILLKYIVNPFGPVHLRNLK